MLPTIGIVLLLSFTIAPIPPSILLLFLFGAAMLVVGMMFFTLGAELAMSPIGEKIGTRIAQSRKLGVVLLLCFILGFIITISAGAGRAGSLDPQCHSDRGGGAGGGSLSHGGHASDAFFQNLTVFIDLVLSVCFSPGLLRAR